MKKLLLALILLPSLCFGADFTYLKFQSYSGTGIKRCSVTYAAGGGSNFKMPFVDAATTKHMTIPIVGFVNYSVPTALTTVPLVVRIRCVNVTSSSEAVVRMFLDTSPTTFPVSEEFFQFK
jgi:hypothetical protein